MLIAQLSNEIVFDFPKTILFTAEKDKLAKYIVGITPIYKMPDPL